MSIKINEAELIEAIGGLPAHIRAIGNALRYDLMHGPSWLRIPGGDIEKIDDDCLAPMYEDAKDEMEDGDNIEQTYVGDAAAAFADWCDALPTLYYEEWSGCLLTSASEGEEDEETGEWIDPEPCYEIGRDEILAKLFGKTFAREYR